MNCIFLSLAAVHWSVLQLIQRGPEGFCHLHLGSARVYGVNLSTGACTQYYNCLLCLRSCVASPRHHSKFSEQPPLRVYCCQPVADILAATDLARSHLTFLSKQMLQSTRLNRQLPLGQTVSEYICWLFQNTVFNFLKFQLKQNYIILWPMPLLQLLPVTFPPTPSPKLTASFIFDYIC